MADLSQGYAEVHERLCHALENGADALGSAPVPACPGWSVADVVAHHCGVVVDVVNGHAPEFFGGVNLLDQWCDDDVARARDELTNRQVTERRGRPLQSVLDEWRHATIDLLEILRGERSFPDPVPAMFGSVLVNDAVVHEADIRIALQLGRPPDGLAAALALRGYGFSLDRRLRIVGLPPLVLAYEGKTLQLGGEGEPGATLAGSRFDLVRVLASRRTPMEIRLMDWTDDPEPYLPVLPEYGPVAHPLGG